MRVTVLGCGSSGGVPRVGNNWGVCDPANPRNRRRRSSIMVEADGARVLVDTSPDLREQLLDARVTDLDAVIWTHEHADQAHGIDDLRALAIDRRRRVDCYAMARTLGVLRGRFSYCFEQSVGSSYPPIVRGHEIDGPFRIGALQVVPFEQAHGDISSLGLRFGPVAYSNDVVSLSEDAFSLLKGVEIWIVDALRHEPHPSHAHLALTLSWIARLGPRRAILTNLHHTMDYEALSAELPAGVEPAYDGMVIEP